MTHVATLIAHPSFPFIEDAHVARAAALLPGAGAPDWLDPGAAVDIPFTGEGGADEGRIVADRLRAELAPAQFDIIVQPVAHRRKRLFLADMDSTMIAQECIDELAAFAGLKAHVSAITERAMRGEIAFEPALRERVALLKGLPESIIDEVVAKHITLTPGGRTLVMTMRANGAYAALVSGGFTPFTSRIAKMVGFDEDRANRLVIAQGQFAGLVEEPILGKEAKRATLAELREARGLDPRETMAVGDGANDLAMLGEAGLGVAFRAKPAVAAAAHARVDHSDLTALLFAQGYRRSEFVTV